MPSCTSQVRSVLISSAVIVLALPVSGLAQQRPTAASQEYRFASSPLPNGGKVTSQSVPGSPNQILTTVSGLPAPPPATVPTSGRDNNVLNRLPAATPGPRNVNFQAPTLGMGPSRPRPVIDDCQCKATEPTAYQAIPGLLPASSTNAGIDNARYAVSSDEATTAGSLFEPTRYQNLPPGTYMGKSLFGKSQAYVDGEPIGNILRFLSF